MTAPTYPRIDAVFADTVWVDAGNAFTCDTDAEATLALRAPQDAFAAGQRSMIQAHGDRLERAIEALKPAVGEKQ